MSILRLVRKKVLIASGITLLVLFLGNLIFLDWKIFGRVSEASLLPKTESSSGLIEEVKPATASCELLCRQVAREEIEKELSRLPSPAGQSSVSPSTSVIKSPPVPTNGKPKEFYVPLVNEGSVSSVSWADIVPSDFYFDLSNYMGAKEIRFEAYLLSSNNDQAYARLYDATNKRGVDYSELGTTKSSFTSVASSGVKIWQGNNKYTVQLRSTNGTLVQLRDAKLKIIY